MECNKCKRICSKLVNCNNCDVIYCKKLCRNQDYIQHIPKCRKKYTIEHIIKSFPLLRLVTNSIAEGGFYEELFAIGKEGNKDLFVEIDMNDYLNGKELTIDDISACTTDLWENRKTTSLIFHLRMQYQDEIIGEYILAVKK